MWLRKTIEKSRGRRISRQDNDMYKSRGIVQSNGGSLCPALAEHIRQKPHVDCDERIYQGLEQIFKEKTKEKVLC